jgi:hypothetical protein
MAQAPTPMPLEGQPDNAQRIKSFLDLYQQQMERFHQTQEVEWKANFGVWSLLAGAIYLARDRPLNLSTCLAWLIFSVPAIHAWWLSKVHRSLEADKELWCRYRGEALSSLRGNAVLLPHEEYKPKSTIEKTIWIALPVSMTLLLALLFAVLPARA